ncbi:MAG: rhodanese-like domain-containing protein [Candidatus Bathyarchaeota archaeon]|nr:rhodanese-like domain-containing protein [Candidatus Bathyarchaeota archaeon]
MVSHKIKVLLIILSLCFMISIGTSFRTIIFVQADNNVDNGDIEKVRIVDRDALKKKIDKNEDFVLLDARIFKKYEIEHIIGAISLPVNEAEERAEIIIPDKNKEIIVYCSSKHCTTSAFLVEILVDLGYTNVANYEGGIRDWTEAGYPTEKNEITPTTTPTITKPPEEAPTDTEAVATQNPTGYINIIGAIIIILIIFSVALVIRRRKGRILFGEEY